MAIYDGWGNLIPESGDASPLTGATWLPTGDSITNNGSYREPIKAQFGLTVVTGGYGDGWQVGYASGAAFCILEKLANLPGTTPDIITIALGTNDFGKTPMGTISDGADCATVENYTFYGCYKQLIERLYAKYGNVPMVLITPFPRIGGWTADSNGNTLRDYAEAILEIGAHYSIPVCDMNRECGIPIGTLAEVGDKWYTEDGLHLNAIAGGIVGPKIAHSMELAMDRWTFPCESLTAYVGSGYVGPDVELAVGESVRLFATRSPAYTTERVIWEITGDGAVATLATYNNYCVAQITGVAAGTCTVTARCGDAELAYDVTVS